MKKLLLALALGYGIAASAQSKDSTRSTSIKALVESQNYVFKAQTALPARSEARLLTEAYSMQISKARIDCDLPYFGRAFTPPIDPSKNGMDFVSKQFDYTVTPDKKGGWLVVIKPKDVREDSHKFYLNITQNGYASLRVISTNEDEISYAGVIAATN